MNIGKSALILAIILVATVAGYLLYSDYFSSSTLENKQLISDNAVFVLESDQADQSWNKLVNHPLWEKIKTIPSFEKIATNLSTLDSLTGFQGHISRLLNGNNLTISYHPTGAESFDLLYILQLDKSSLENLLSSIKSNISGETKLVARTYSETEITEVTQGSDSRLMSFTYLNGLLVLSESSFLVEEAIRKSQVPADELIPANLTASGEKGLATLWLRGKSLASFLKGVIKERESQQIRALENLDASVAYEFFLDANQIRFEGNLDFSEAPSFTPSLAANISEIQKAISARTVSLTQFNLQGIAEIQQLENRGFVPKSTIQAEVQQNLIDQGFLDGFGGEFYLQELESRADGSSNLVLVARLLNDNEPLDILKNYLQKESETYSDFYGNDEVFYVPTEELPAYLFSGKFVGFPQTFVIRRGNIILFANSQEAVKMLLDDLNRGYTWDSNALPDYLRAALSPSAGFSQTYRIKEIWNKWTTLTNSSWSSYFQKYRPVFSAFPYLTLRVNQIGEEAKSSILITFDETAPEIEIAENQVNLQSDQVLRFNQRLNWGPKEIINYQDNSKDLILQDQDHTLYLINSAGEIVYRYPLSGPVISDAFQVDYFKNGKLQLLLATKDKIYGIDRLGNPLTGYPFDLKESITHLQLVDYDNTRDYRYFVATESANLLLLDKTGNKLEGWNPNPISENSLQSPRHYRVPGVGDYMGTLTSSGKLHLFNRRGEKQSGSPFDLSASFQSELFFGKSTTTNRFVLTGVSTDGQVIEVSFNGEVVNRNQLEKDDRDSEFKLIPDQNQNQFIILSKTFNQLKVFNSKQEVLFNIRVSEERLVYQYFDFGSDRQIFAVTDPLQNFTYLYDLSGNLLTNLPLDSSGPIQISFDQRANQYAIHTIMGDQMITYFLSA